MEGNSPSKEEGKAGLKERSSQGGHQPSTCINPSLLCSTLLVGALWELRQLQKVLSSVADHLSNPSRPAGPTDRERGSGMDTKIKQGGNAFFIF